MKRSRYLLRNPRENAKTVANQATSQHTAYPRWSEKRKMRSSTIIVRNHTISGLSASNY